MSDSESSPLASSLHASIQQLVSETVRRSKQDSGIAFEEIQSVMQAALQEIEMGKEAYARAEKMLRDALISFSEGKTADSTAPAEIVAPGVTPPTHAPETSQPESADVSTIAPGEVHVIAHDVTIGIASELQAMLRTLPEIASAQTREFVNGQLHLKLHVARPLDLLALTTWLRERGGNVSTQTDSVLELRFDA